MFSVECLCIGHATTESLTIKNQNWTSAQHFTHQITLTLLNSALTHTSCMDLYNSCATSQIFKFFGYMMVHHFFNSLPSLWKKITDLFGVFSFSSFLQSTQPDCSSHGGLPVMASSGQPLDLYPGWHTPASLAVGLSVPAAGGGSQRNGEATWDTVWTQTQEELTWQRK